MIDIKNLKDSIDNVSMESALCVLDAMFGVIDKNEYINEYDENNVLSGIFTEAMMIFMESKNRERDKTPRNEISKWMEKKGYWYTGDNPKKKKECNRMYHFLQQHDFRPSDETYKTDFNDKDGNKKRIKLNIDKISFLDAGLLESIKKGENAFYNVTDKSINVGSKTLKRQQSNSQFMLKHEEGHAEDSKEFDGVPLGGIMAYQKQLDNQNYNKESKFIKAAKRKGLNVNSHDEQGSELKADAYAALHSQKRTKGASYGDNVRNFNKNDLLHAFKEIDRLMEKTGFSTTSSDVLQLLNDSEKAINKVMNNTKLTDNDIKSITGTVKYLSNTKSPLFNKTENMIKTLSVISDMTSNLLDRDSDERFRKALKKVYTDYDIDDKMIESIDSKLKKINGISNKIKNKISDIKDKVIVKTTDAILSGFKNDLKDLIKHIDNLKKDVKKCNKCVSDIEDMSTKMRYMYSKKYIKEYFNELYNDYFFYG